MLALLLVLAIAAILAMNSHVQTTMNVPVKLITATQMPTVQTLMALSSVLAFRVILVMV